MATVNNPILTPQNGVFGVKPFYHHHLRLATNSYLAILSILSQHSPFHTQQLNATTQLRAMVKDDLSTSEPIPAPEDNIKPLDYKDQFSVRSCLSTGTL